MIKGLRRSLKGDRQSAGSHAASGAVLSPKSSLSILPPRKVIKALYDYAPESPVELSFSRGDFFHVIGQEDDPYWYEACNPITSSRGLVPVKYFQVIGKNEREISGSFSPLTHERIISDSSQGSRLDSPSEAPSPCVFANPSRKSGSGRPSQPLYGIVQYNFVAERPDELTASAGEAIIVIAQSNHEWLVAKPIGRLGGPGLIPLAFIEIRDVSTGLPVENAAETVAQADIPKVEEWKKMTADYKNSSIPLGKFDFLEQPPRSMITGAPLNPAFLHSGTQAYGEHAVASHQRQPSSLDHSYHQRQPSSLDHNYTYGLLLPVKRARVEQFFHTGERYWFLVTAEMNDGRHRNLCRFYENFYDFQIALLNAFPVEAGKTGGTRTLPYMPGPLANVNDTITTQRRKDLDIYVQELCNLPYYIREHFLVKQLFATREGDVESPHPTSKVPEPSFFAQPAHHNSPLSAARHSGGLRSPAQIRADLPSKAINHLPHTAPNSLISRVTEDMAALNTKSQNGTPILPPLPLLNTSVDNSNPSMATPQDGTPGTIKLKCFHNDEIYAMKIPIDITFDQVMVKLKERSGGGINCIRYRGESDGQLKNVDNNDDLHFALQNTAKPVLYAS